MKGFIFAGFLSSLFAGGGVNFSEGETGETYHESLLALRSHVKEKYEEALTLSRSDGNEAEYKNLLGEIKICKKQIQGMEETWRKTSISDAKEGEETYALWDVGETTLSQLVMEYGASDYLYIIPPELSTMKISLFSSIPLPRESWEEMIELILVHNGVGIKKLNPFAKQLYVLKLDPGAVEGVVSKEDDLGLFSAGARIFYVLSPPVEQLKSLQSFFERFSDPKQTSVQAVGSKVVLVSHRDTVEKLLGLYRAVWEKEQGKTVRLVRSTKVLPQEAEKVLKAFFTETNVKARPNFSPVAADELTILPLPQGLVLIGENDTVLRGEKVIHDLESQLEDPGEKIIYWYTCKHSSPEDVAAVLEKVYVSLVDSGFDKKEEGKSQLEKNEESLLQESKPISHPNTISPGQSASQTPVLPANPPFVQAGTIDRNQKTTFGNFIVDTKTTSVLMVVRREELPKIKTLLKKMDVPKKMVQIEVLLVEKKLTDRKQIGFDLLQFGKNKSGNTENAVSFDTQPGGANRGVLSYLFSRTNGDVWPAMDIRYSFLLSQEDVRIHSTPSIITTNQVPATISVVDEISINNGAFPVQTSSGLTTTQDSFTRAQYGTTLVLTPTVHMPQGEDELDQESFISLQTNIEFDTTKVSTDNRPPVTRRHIENEVCIPDGETIVLGGLRSKMEQDARDKIPFLGDLPGFGKLFGSAKQTDIDTEMFIFITPKIIHDPKDDLRKIRQSEYQKRAGDTPEFLVSLDEARKKERKHLFDKSLKVLFDMY